MSTKMESGLVYGTGYLARNLSCGSCGRNMVKALTTSKSNGDASLTRFCEMWLCGCMTITIMKFVSPNEKTVTPPRVDPLPTT